MAKKRNRRGNVSDHRRFPTEPRPQGFHVLKVISGTEAFFKSLSVYMTL